MTNRESFDLVLNARTLSRELVHHSIRGSVWAMYIRGEYDTAVLKAFKSIEVEVRTKGNFPNSDFGESLMRKAFDPDKGPLSDMKAEPNERRGLAHLFAGAFGYFRNPLGHRNVDISDPLEAGEMIIFASHLLRIIESRPKVGAGNPS